MSKTFTLTEIATNLRAAEDSGLLAKLRVTTTAAASALAVALGYPITEEGYARFDRDMTEAGV